MSGHMIQNFWSKTCSFCLPCPCFPPFPLVTLFILLPPSKFSKVIHNYSNRRDQKGTRAEKGSGVVLPGEQRGGR